jgi:hypothetical protein
MAMQFYGASVLGSYVSNQVFVSRRLNTRSWDSICYLIPVIDQLTEMRNRALIGTKSWLTTFYII